MISFKKAAGGILSTALLFNSTPLQAQPLVQQKEAPIMAASSTTHEVKVTYYLLYMNGSTASAKKQEVVTYTCADSGSHTNHRITYEELRAERDKLASKVESGYIITNWAKESGANATRHNLDGTGTVDVGTNKNIYFVCDRDGYDYTLVYNANGGSNAPQTQTVLSKDSSYTFALSSSKPTRAGYTFQGWSDYSWGNASYQPGESITLKSTSPSKTVYAVWQANETTYTLSYNANGGSNAPASQSAESSAASYSFSVSSQTPVKEGYTFVGWADSASASSASYQGGSSITLSSTSPSKTLYAVWQKDEVETEFTLSFNPNGGTDAPATISQTSTAYSVNFVIPEGTPKRYGYTFLGWSETEGETQASFLAKKILGNAKVFAQADSNGLYNAGDTITVTKDAPAKTLYAVWEKIPEVQNVTLTYMDGLEKIGQEIVSKGGTVILISYGETSDKKFLGWSEDPNAAEATYKAGQVITLDRDMTLYPIWGDNSGSGSGGGTTDPVDPTDPDNPDEPGKKNTYPGMEKIIINADGNEIDETKIKPGETVTFKLESNVPDNLFKYVQFESHKTDEGEKLVLIGEYPLALHDKMSGDFVMDNNSISVKLVRDDGKEAVIPSENYSVNPCPDLSMKEICDFHVLLDLVDLYNKGVINEQDVRKATKIVVTYNVTLRPDAKAGKHINTAWVSCPESMTASDFVEIDVFDIQVVKVDSADTSKKLKGAIFELYDGPAAQESRKLVAALETGDDGTVTFKGLQAGTYYLVEKQAPSTYIRMTAEMPITLSNELDSFTYVKEVKNTTAPSTGGAGTAMFTAGGAALLGGALLE